ncbi:MAG: hypothetical protein ABSE73_21810 [Planctomycetota bacterium]
MSKFMAFATQIPKDKFNQWEKFAHKLNTEFRKEFNESRKNAGIHERTFLQRTPVGDFVIVTLEGNEPLAAETATNAVRVVEWFTASQLDILAKGLAYRDFQPTR